MLKPDLLKNALLSVINKIAESSGEYGNNMENFTGRRKLTFFDVVRLLLTTSKLYVGNLVETLEGITYK